jgi:tetratricopeptide (TPR) repeat protein
MLALALLILSSQPVKDEAKQHRDAGNSAFDIAEYDRAIEEFKRAYELEPDPRLFYNLGLAHLKKSELATSRPDLVQARDYFKRFLAFTQPNDPKLQQLRQLSEGYIGRLEERLAKPEPPPPTKIVEVQVPPPQIDHTTSFVILGSSGALAAVAIVTGVFAVRASNDAHAHAYAGELMQAESSSNSARNFALATDVFIVSGVLAAAAGIVLYFLESP